MRQSTKIYLIYISIYFNLNEKIAIEQYDIQPIDFLKRLAIHLYAYLLIIHLNLRNLTMKPFMYIFCKNNNFNNS